MNALLKNIYLFTFVLNISWKSTESLSLDFKSYEYDNRTLLSRFGRQAQKQECKPGEFRCKNGQCVNWKCNGYADCEDESDETEELCLNSQCKGLYLFKCKYGACVAFAARCNNKQDCIDNSDEENCFRQTHRIACITQKQPENGFWYYVRDARRGEANETARAQTLIGIACNEGYKLSTTNDIHLSIYCDNDGRWSIPKWPTCQKLCPAMHSSPLINLECVNDDVVIPCAKAIDNTILTYRCAPNHKRLNNDSIVCKDGLWSSNPECVSVESRSESNPQSQPSGIKCVTYEHPGNGRWTYLNGRQGEVNETVDVNTVISFSCNDHYKVSMTYDEFLLITCQSDGRWSVPEWPACQLTCPALYNTLRVRFTCQHDGVLIPCDRATVNSTLTYKCAPNHVMAYGKPETITCHYGAWNYTYKPECILAQSDSTRQLQQSGCFTPKQPQFGKWVYHPNGTQGTSNQKADDTTVIKFFCDEGYKLSSTHNNNYLIYCYKNETWSVSEMPTCLKLCRPLYDTPHMTLTCSTEDGTSVPCDKATDRIILRYKCAPYYEPADGRTDSILCYNNGLWERIPQCAPVCGEKIVSATTFIVKGQPVERKNYPWVVAIYSDKEFRLHFANICAGSLITTDVVLTAAHCMTRVNGKAYPLKYYRVAAGKYFNMYGDERDNDTAQYAEIAEIKTNKEYKGDIQNFRGDIALLRLKTPFVLTKVVQPVCYSNLPESIPRTLGLVTGWGYTISSGNSSDVLKEIELPYTEEEQCLSELDEEFAQRYLTSDKFCAGFYNESRSVCRGDSGGGLVYKNPSYKNRFFIHGIVSIGPSYIEDQVQHCNIQRRALFTNVYVYSDWIKLTLAFWDNKTKSK